MPRRKELKSVAYGVADHFVSRYNEIDGYWALGILYKQANHNKIHTITLDIIKQEIHPNQIDPTDLLTYFHSYLNKLLINHHFKPAIIQKAIIEINFHIQATDLENLYKNIYGDPFECTVYLTDDLHKTFFSKRRGCCKEHSKEKECQSLRVLPHLSHP